MPNDGIKREFVEMDVAKAEEPSIYIVVHAMVHYLTPTISASSWAAR